MVTKRLQDDHRSGCPINLTLEVIGDKWSLLVIRDIMFGDRRHFRELLTRSEEGIASNILADRLKRLLAQGIIRRANDAGHRQRVIYSLTEKGIELLPVLVGMAIWGRKYMPASRELRIRAQIMEEGGPKLWDAFMAELREEHLPQAGRVRKARRPSIRQQFQAAVEAAMAGKKRS